MNFPLILPENCFFYSLWRSQIFFRTPLMGPLEIFWRKSTNFWIFLYFLAKIGVYEAKNAIFRVYVYLYMRFFSWKFVHVYVYGFSGKFVYCIWNSDLKSYTYLLIVCTERVKLRGRPFLSYVYSAFGSVWAVKIHLDIGFFSRHSKSCRSF